jgi:hypothetical protein
VDGASCTLCALIAPGSVEAEVGRIQQGIFSAHGLVSAVALPPLVPIAYLASEARARELLGELDASVSAPWRIGIAGAVWVSGFLYLGIDSGGMWGVLRARALALRGTEPAGPFPPDEGFFLGCPEATAEQREAIHPPAPGTRFTSGALALVRIETAGGGPWWSEVSWETIEQRPLRGRRKR